MSDPGRCPVRNDLAVRVAGNGFRHPPGEARGNQRIQVTPFVAYFDLSDFTIPRIGRYEYLVGIFDALCLTADLTLTGQIGHTPVVDAKSVDVTIDNVRPSSHVPGVINGFRFAIFASQRSQIAHDAALIKKSVLVVVRGA